MNKGDYLFVYGTLRRGERADLSAGRAAHGCMFIGQDRINGLIYNLGWYPGLKRAEHYTAFNPDEPTVLGDLFNLTEQSITAWLDAYEGYPSLYNRVLVETMHGRNAWVYTYNHEVSPDGLIASGDWQQRPKMIAA